LLPSGLDWHFHIVKRSVGLSIGDGAENDFQHHRLPLLDRRIIGADLRFSLASSARDNDFVGSVYPGCDRTTLANPALAPAEFGGKAEGIYSR
jgi:hypothetical protein